MSSETFETLNEMGIEDVHDIEKYTYRTEGDIDILKIYFHRHHGEWFSKSKKYKFKRAEKVVPSGGGAAPYHSISEPSSYFLNALAELEKLVSDDRDAQTRKEQLLDELEHLEKVMTRKMEDIRRQIEEL